MGNSSRRCVCIQGLKKAINSTPDTQECQNLWNWPNIKILVFILVSLRNRFFSIVNFVTLVYTKVVKKRESY